jgi:GNAT superfamily N-acetyltransferase
VFAAHVERLEPMNELGAERDPLFMVSGLRAVELGALDIPCLQRFFEQNPGYFIAVNGEVAGKNEAREEVYGEPPAGWPFTKKWLIGIVAQNGSLVAMLNVVSDLLALNVWHIGLFMAATELRGNGTAQSLFLQLARWTLAGGPKRLRLGVVEGNARAQRFWQRCGFIEVRMREGVAMGKLINTVRVMAKPLVRGTLPEYLALVERDKAQAP